MGKVKLAIPRKQNEVVRSDLQCIILGSDERRKSCIISIASPSPAGNGTGMYSVRTQAVVRDLRTVEAEYRTQDMWRCHGQSVSESAVESEAFPFAELVCWSASCRASVSSFCSGFPVIRNAVSS